MAELISMFAGGYLAPRAGYKGQGVTLAAQSKDAGHGASFTFSLTTAEARQLARRLDSIADEVDAAEAPR